MQGGRRAPSALHDVLIILIAWVRFGTGRPPSLPAAAPAEHEG